MPDEESEFLPEDDESVPQDDTMQITVKRKRITVRVRAPRGGAATPDRARYFARSYFG